MLPFLLEIGVEEVPDWMIEPALAGMRDLFTKILADQKLGGQVTWTDATPRRLVLRADNLQPTQPNETRTVSGPPISSGPGAATGFAKKLNITVDQLEKLQTPKGEYFSYQEKVQGRPTLDILSEVLPKLISAIPFPKTMYWAGKNSPKFIRPIRWILCLLGDNQVPFHYGPLPSGNTTIGHRVLGPGPVEVTIANYEETLRARGVILHAAERKAKIESELGPNVQPDAALLKTLVYLTEYPTAIRGYFAPAYLHLPKEILSTVMRHHQRYFTVVTDTNQLAPEFVAVTNTESDPQGLIRLGNERVLRARFNDARFFWEQDLHRSLQERVEDLRKVTFQAKLGSYFEKGERTVALARQFSHIIGVDENICARAALLCKSDLTTEMVKEFPELQGVVGGLYAAQQGESVEVSKAIYEHYRPTSMDDPIPATLPGQTVSLADKVDTLRGCFSIDLIPTGSRDPFALRRAAQGVVRILAEGKQRLTLTAIAEGNQQLLDFLLDRVQYYYREVRGFAYDEIAAVTSPGCDDLTDFENRLVAIQAARATPDFEPVANSFKRIANILRQNPITEPGEVNIGLMDYGAEQDLHSAFLHLKDLVYTQRKSQNYRAALETIASIRPHVDLYFDDVLVNAPQERVRRNRLLFLNSLLSEFSTIADFSEIVPSKEI